MRSKTRTAQMTRRLCSKPRQGMPFMSTAAVCVMLSICVYVCNSLTCMHSRSGLQAWRISMRMQFWKNCQTREEHVLCVQVGRQSAAGQRSMITCRNAAARLHNRCIHRPTNRFCCVASIDFKTSSKAPSNIFQLASLQPREVPTSVSSIFSFASGSADCVVTPQLIKKFGET